tara:strand:- start:669 stop:1478 length:810 start_codon:yes stop_codon:yes gene_type:complete
MDLLTLLAIFCLLIVAVAFSPLGLGGGILYVPIIHYMLNWEIKESLVASLTLVFMVSIGSSLAHSKSGLANHQAANIGRLSAMPSAIIGVILSGLLLSFVGDIGIKILASCVIIFVLDRAIRKPLPSEDSEQEEIDINQKRNQYLVGSSVAGMCSGILGIGGGAILVTINRSILKMDSKMAAGTSYLIAVTIVPVALLSHLIMSRNLEVIFNDTGMFAIIIVPLLVLISAFFGAKYSIKYLPKQVVRSVFILVVLISLLKYISDLSSSI